MHTPRSMIIHVVWLMSSVCFLLMVATWSSPVKYYIVQEDQLSSVQSNARCFYIPLCLHFFPVLHSINLLLIYPLLVNISYLFISLYPFLR